MLLSSAGLERNGPYTCFNPIRFTRAAHLPTMTAATCPAEPAKPKFRSIAKLILEEHVPPAKLKRLEAACRAETTYALISRVRGLTAQERLSDGKRVGRFVIEQELTRRRVPPSLRESEELDAKDEARVTDQYLIDLEWLVSRYPTHRPDWSRYQRLFEPGDLLKRFDWTHVKWPRPYWSALRGLGLAVDQMAECVWLATGEARNRKFIVRYDWEKTLKLLRRGYLTPASNRGIDIGLALETVKERLALWRVATIYGDSPTRVAEAMTALTGKRMTRQVAYKQITKMRRDLRRGRDFDT